MNFSTIIRKKNSLLLPFSLLYKLGVYIYHSLYHFGLKKAYSPPIPTICIGNLSVGGTGKSPMVEYLLRLIQALQDNPTGALSPKEYHPAVLSRGYRRKTRGYVLAEEGVTAADIGDEHMQFYQKFPAVTIAVAEKRVEGIRLLIEQKPKTDVIILDDAFQHRAVKAGLNILLTDYNHLYYKDGYLPAGSLRDLKSSANRADMIVVTKTDRNISETERQRIIKAIRPLAHQRVFFTAISYGTAYPVFNKEAVWPVKLDAIVLVTGIANPAPVLEYLKQYQATITHFNYPDHYSFSSKDIEDILNNCGNTENRIILTTEKDAVRLMEWGQLAEVPVFALPIRHDFLFNEGKEFDQRIANYINKTPSSSL